MVKILFWSIMAICCIMAVYGLIKERKDGFINLFLRLAAGMIGILCLNGVLNACGLTSVVGINAFSLSVLAGLGAPGFVLLYILSFLL